MLACITLITYSLLFACSDYGSAQSLLVDACPGYCTTALKSCFDEGAVVTRLCTVKEACCDNRPEMKARVGSCGTFKRKDSKTPWLLFRSPDFPTFLHGDLLCSFTFELEDDVAGVEISFGEFTSDNFKPGPTNSICDQDIMYMRGFGDWAPPGFCGNLVGYKMVIDDSYLQGVTNLTLLAVMSSSRYRWSVLIRQYRTSSCGGPPPYLKTEENSNDDDLTDNSDRIIETMQTYASIQTMHQSLEEPYLTPYVINGEDSVLGKIPWQASIRVTSVFAGLQAGREKCNLEEGFHFCGASIISDQEVLTAAHCFFASSKTMAMQHPTFIRVFIGDINNCRDEDEAVSKSVQQFKVESITIHFGYDPTLVLNDVAVIRLDRAIKFNENVKPIKLASAGDKFYGHDALVSGWGQTNLRILHSGSYVLQYSDNLEIDAYETCRLVLSRYLGAVPLQMQGSHKYKGIYDSLLCTKAKEGTKVGVGRGDSGGPLVSYRTNLTEPILVGIVSYMLYDDGMAIKSNNIFQSVAYFRRWIDVTLCGLRDQGELI